MKNTRSDQEIQSANSKNRVTLPDGTQIPGLGQGTWHLAERANRRSSELEALQSGIPLGMTLIDTAEMYGDGRSESLVGEVIQGTERDKLFLVSKVYPHNAGRRDIFNSCENSLKRLHTDYLDLYLLHWRGSVPLSETVACMEELIQRGLIRRWGVSNFDTDDMEDLWNTPGGDQCAVNQVLYHLGSRGVEYDLLPWMRERRIPMMAYCPLAQAGSLRRGLLENPVVRQVAEKHEATAAQILLAFILHHDDIIAIPKSSTTEHTRENAAAGMIKLDASDLAALSRAYPSPKRKMPLDMQ